MIELRTVDGGVVLPVQVQAGARRNGILGVRNGMVRVAVTAAPEKGKANEAIVRILSEEFGVAKSAIELVSGATSAKKQFLVVGRRVEEVRRVIESIVGDSAR
jgi:uncharacterized protein